MKKKSIYSNNCGIFIVSLCTTKDDHTMSTLWIQHKYRNKPRWNSIYLIGKSRPTKTATIRLQFSQWAE